MSTNCFPVRIVLTLLLNIRISKKTWADFQLLIICLLAVLCIVMLSNMLWLILGLICQTMSQFSV